MGYCAGGGNKILHWKGHLKCRLQMQGSLTSLVLMFTELLVLLFFHIVVMVAVLEMSLQGSSFHNRGKSSSKKTHQTYLEVASEKETGYC